MGKTTKKVESVLDGKISLVSYFNIYFYYLNMSKTSPYLLVSNDKLYV